METPTEDQSTFGFISLNIIQFWIMFWRWVSFTKTIPPWAAFGPSTICGWTLALQGYGFNAHPLKALAPALSVPWWGQYRYRAGLSPCPYRCCTVGAPVSNGARTVHERQSNGKANAFGQRKGPQIMRPLNTMTSWRLIGTIPTAIQGTHRLHQRNAPERQSYIAATRLYGTLSGQMYSKRVIRL